MAALRVLIGAIRSSAKAVDVWIETTSRTFPVIHERGWALDKAKASRGPRRAWRP